MKKTAASRRKTMAPARLQTPRVPPSLLSTSVKKESNQSSVVNGCLPGVSRRKASTPTHDKPTRTDSPDISHIMPMEISAVDPVAGKPRSAPVSKPKTGGKPASAPVSKPKCGGKQTSAPFSKTAPGSDEDISLADKLDFEYTRYLQTMFRRKLAEAEASEMDDKLIVLQKRIAENQNILQKATERLKNINFNKEVETLHRLRNPNYGLILDTLNNANCKEYLETMNEKLEQNQNQLKTKNIELAEGGGAELLQTIKETVAACEKLKANNNLELHKVMAEIKSSNNSTSETLSRCLEVVPEVEELMLDKTTLEICTRDE